MTDAAFASLLPDACSLSAQGTRIGRWTVSSLAAAFGTPLYVYDAETLRSNAAHIQKAFAPLDTRVSFAAKACSTIGVLRVLQHCDLHLDAVSEGEMVAALRAGFVAERIHLHGNCKSERELEFAVRRGIRAIVADSADELLRIADVSRRLQRVAGVSIRTLLPVEADTHPHLLTSGAGSKFGIERGSSEEARALDIVAHEASLSFQGIHCHAGSQIADSSIYSDVAAGLVSMAREVSQAGLPVPEVSLGGGWAVPYVPGGTQLQPEAVAESIGLALRELPGVRVAVEPGRALVARAALAIYRVGSVKYGPQGRIVAVDGGMADNPRPALYDAQYTAFCVDRPLDAPVGPVDVVGRYCEAGDVLARGVPLPEVRFGDLLCVPVSGAYQMTMAGNYNLVPRPAAVMVDGRDARLMTHRESISNVLSREMGYSDWKLV